MTTFACRPTSDSGFTLLEVLIALLILSIGLLGIAALQATSLKTNHGAYLRSQAVILGYDMMDRMRANRVVAMAEGYDINMASNGLTGAGLQVADVNGWLASVAALLPAGDGSIDCTTAGVCTVTVQWDTSRGGGSASGGNNTLSFQVTAQI
ncbi:MAG: type IV pilus modification protein PilV [Gammaproteobacteria bacterium]